jgi:hypothetical protein
VLRLLRYALLRLRSLPWLLCFTGVAIKGTLTASVHFLQAPRLVHFIVVTTDPLGLRVADAIVSLFFDQRRLAPTEAESLIFEVVLVAFFGLECFLVGWLISRIWRRFAVRLKADTTYSAPR